MSADLYEAPRAHRPIIERQTYVPSHYVEHKDPSLPVRDRNNGLLGFTIGEVLPERRWAIGPDGMLIGELEFDRLYKDWISRVVVAGGRIVSIASVNRHFDMNIETIPNADDFVNAKIDPTRGEVRFIEIHYDPTNMAGRSKIRPIYNANGEKVVAGAEQPEPAPGFVRSVAPQPEPDPEPDPGEPAPPPEVKKAKPVALVAALCGKELPANRLKVHQRLCKACKAKEADAA